MDAPLCKLCEKRHYGTCDNPRVPADTSQRKGKSARPKKKSRQKAPGLPDGEARLFPDAPRVMRPADQLPLDERIAALEQIVDELLAGKRKRSEYMKAYMRDRRARDGG